MPDGNRLEGQVALVVGASRGIGRAISLRIARDGADVVVASRNISALEEVASEIHGMCRRAHAVQTDIRILPQIEQMVQTTIANVGRIDILVYNSGMLRVERLTDSSDEIWEETLAVNLMGAVRVTREVLNRGEMLQRKRGRIVLIASEAGKVGTKGLAAYTASKHGLLGLMRCLSLETGTEGSR